MFKKVLLLSVVIFSILFNLMVIPSLAAVDSDSYDAVAVAKLMTKTDVFDLKAKSAVLMDTASGSVLLEKNSHEKVPIASVTKVMSMLLVMEAVDSGKLKMDDKVSVSEYSASMGGSQAYLKPGEEFTVNEMLKAVAIHSSNDVTVALAEKVSGSEDAFVAEMNAKAQELGMNDTHFLDCTGLTDEGQSSANDVALMSRELITKHPKILEYTSTWHDTFRNGTFSLDNTNKLIHYYQGCDGLKTGFTNKAGHNLASTAVRNNHRLLSVVLGEPDSNTRFAESRKLLDYGFANFEVIQVNNKGEEVGTVEVKKGVNSSVKAIFGEDVKILMNKGDKSKVTREVKLDSDVTAPVQAGQKVGEVTYKVGDKVVGTAAAVAENTVDKASFVRLFLRMVIQWFGLGRA